MKNDNYVKIGSRNIGKGRPCFIIAEAGSNHNGNLVIAKKLIDSAAEMGADAIKFQIFTAESLSNDKATQDILRKYEFRKSWISSLNKHARSKGIMFFATPFDMSSTDALSEIGVKAFKIASGDLTYLNFIEYIARKKKPIILSVGMATEQEIKNALKVIFSTGNRNVILLHCIADYPTRPEDANIKCIASLQKLFNVPVGYSDHTLGVHISMAAVCLGAAVIEKHFTLSRKMKGPDHPFAIEPNELKELVRGIRDIERAGGDGRKRPAKCEIQGLRLGRRSLFAAREIPKGKIINQADIKAVRPSIGIGANFYDSVVGKKARQKITCGEPIKWIKIA